MAKKKPGPATATPAPAVAPAVTRTPSKPSKPSLGAQRSQRAGTDTRAAQPVKSGKVKVRATMTGYYGMKRRRPGDVFFLDAGHYPQLFSKRWMELVEPATPLKETGAQAALNKRHDEILGGVASKRPGSVEDTAATDGRAETGDDPDPDSDDDDIQP